MSFARDAQIYSIAQGLHGAGHSDSGVRGESGLASSRLQTSEKSTRTETFCVNAGSNITDVRSGERLDVESRECPD